MNFCTIFDSNYLSRGLAMYNSLMKNSPNSELYIVCLDYKLYEFLLECKYTNIIPILLSEIELNNPKLEKAKNNRSYVEYIFTLSPSIPLFLFKKFPHIEMITSLDADVYFFSDPAILFKDANAFSIAVTPHRFTNRMKYLEKYGHYNVSFQTFKNDEIGNTCLMKWENDCIDWCYDKYEKTRFADQKYLDDWVNIYPNVKIFANGSGVAPWNIKDKDITCDDSGSVYYKNDRLIYFHFHGLRNISSNLFSIGLNEYLVTRRTKIIKYLYVNYIKELNMFSESEINKFNRNDKIKRGMKLGVGKYIYYIFLADLYLFKEGKLNRIPNFNFVRYINTLIKSIK